MSRSKKIKIYTDKKGWKTRLYLRRVRRVIKQYLNSNYNKEEFLESDIPLAKEIENDYDYCDYKIIKDYIKKTSK